MRLFVALTPPAEVVGALQASTASLREQAPWLRWTRPEQWHLTLAFLGEVEDAAAARLRGRLDRVAARHPPLTLSLRGSGRFGDRVLWVGVQGDRRGLRALADSVRAAARRCGLPGEQGTYRPHVTLARAGNRRSGESGAPGSPGLRPLVEQLAAHQGPDWTAHGFGLIRSRLGAGPGGTAQYETVAEWRLSGRPPHRPEGWSAADGKPDEVTGATE